MFDYASEVLKQLETLWSTTTPKPFFSKEEFNPNNPLCQLMALTIGESKTKLTEQLSRVQTRINLVLYFKPVIHKQSTLDSLRKQFFESMREIDRILYYVGAGINSNPPVVNYFIESEGWTNIVTDYGLTGRPRHFQATQMCTVTNFERLYK